jgi:biopolymer transport protein ExbB
MNDTLYLNRRTCMHKNLFTAALLLGAASAFAGPYDAWTSNRSLTVNTTPTGSNITESLTNFPLLVRLTNASVATGSDVLSGALANGADVRFTSGDGQTAYAYEIESWSATAAAIWVKVPSIAGNALTSLRIYWGKTGEATASSGGAVFDTTGGFVGVWHMGGTGDAADATFNARTATNVGTTGATGNIGPGRTLNGSDQYLTVPDDARLNFTNPAFTLSAWVFCDSWDGGSKRILQKGNGTASPNTNNALQYGLRDNSSNGFAVEVNGTHHNLGSSPSASEWHLITGTLGDGTVSLYYDGVLVSSAAQGASALGVTTTELAIGRQATLTTAGNYFGGIMDEVRVQKVGRSADWIKLEYETQKAGATPLSLGQTQAHPRVRYSLNGHSFEIPASLGADKATMTVTDAYGRTVWSKSIRPSAVRSITWNGTTTRGAKASAGAYVITVTALNGLQSTRLLEEAVTLGAR